MNVLVTAGATRNPIDAVRYLSANASGRTGIDLTRAWRAEGHDVHLLGSVEASLRAPDLAVEVFGDTADLMARTERWVRAHPDGALVHSAAVGDYRVAAPSVEKTPSGRASWTLALVPAPKIADQVRGWGLRGPYVTFKAAAPGTSLDALERIARAQRDRTGCDLVFANVLDHIDRDVLLVGATTSRFATRGEAVAALVERGLAGAQ